MLRHELKRFYSKVDGSQACKKSNLKCHTMITVQIWGDLPSRVTLRSGNFILSTLIFQLYIVYLQKVLWCHLNNERNYLQQHLFHCGQFPVSAICSTVTLESPSFWAVITLVGNCSAGGALPFAKCNALHSCQCMHSTLHSVYSYVKRNMLQPALHYCYLLH